MARVIPFGRCSVLHFIIFQCTGISVFSGEVKVKAGQDSYGTPKYTYRVIPKRGQQHKEEPWLQGREEGLHAMRHAKLTESIGMELKTKNADARQEARQIR